LLKKPTAQYLMRVKEGVAFGPYEPAEFIEGPEAKRKEGEGSRPCLPHNTVV
jgi:hypothetical protein